MLSLAKMRLKWCACIQDSAATEPADLDHFEIQDSGSSYPTGSLPPCQDDRSCCIEIESKFNFERLDVPVTPISSCPQSSLQLIVSPSSHIASATHTEPNTFYTSKDPAFDMLSTNVYNESCQHRELDGERVQEFSKSCCFAASSPVCVTKDPFADISNHDNILTESHTKIPLPTDSDGMVDVLRTADNPKEHKPTPAPPPPTPPTLSPALSCQPENTSILSDVESPASAIFHDRRHTHSLKYKGGAIQAAAGTAVLTEVYEVEGGDRVDHIAIRGVPQRHIEAIHRSAERPPLVFVLNCQIPGDPPVSIVTYFAIPISMTSLDSETAAAVGETSGGKLPGPPHTLWDDFDRFITLPITESERQAYWRDYSNQQGLPARGRAGGWRLWTQTHVNAKAQSQSLEELRASATSISKGPSHDVSSSLPASSSTSAQPESLPSCAHGLGTYPPTDVRNTHFNLLVSITEGPWLARAAVPSVPVAIGQSVTVRYFGGPSYFEADVDVGSNVIASQIVGLCRGLCKHFEVDIGVVIHDFSKKIDELSIPNKLLGCVNLSHIDCNIRRGLD